MHATITSPTLQEERAQSQATVRLASLDLFRGITIAGMILVNDPGDGPSAYWPLEHAEWNGWTPTDLVFPFFLFIVGVAMAFSFNSRLQRGASRSELFRHVLWRGFLLIVIGIVLHGFPNHYQFAHLRFYGVLQRIAVCYMVVAVLELWTGWRTQAIVTATCLAAYWILMRYVPVPGFGMPAHDIPLLDPDRNIVAWLDRKLFMGHLYEGTRDPEGLLSTIPAVSTCLLGLLTGKWLRSAQAPRTKAAFLCSAGMLLFIAGELWNGWFPINKKLWTSSYVLLTAGLALICLAFCYWLADIKQYRGLWTKPFLIFGANAIAAYIFSEALAGVSRINIGPSSIQEHVYASVFSPLASPANASLLYAIAYVVLCWIPMAFLYRKRIFLKI